MADEQSFVIEMILFFKRCEVPIALVVIFLFLPCPEKREERRNSKDSAAAPDSAYSKPQVSKKCIFRIMIILTTSTQLPLDIHNTGTDQYLQPRVKKMTPNAKSLFSIYLTTSLIGNGNRMPVFCPPVKFYCNFVNLCNSKNLPF